MRKIPTPKVNQINEWFNSYVTEYYFLEVIQDLLDQVSEGLRHQGYAIPAEDLKALRAELFGMETAFEQIMNAWRLKSFEKAQLVEVKHEQVGDSPDREPGADSPG